MLLLNQLRKQKDANEDICIEHSHATGVKPGQLEAFEMWCYRRMMNIKWMDRITNEEVIGRIGERKTCGRV